MGDLDLVLTVLGVLVSVCSAVLMRIRVDCDRTAGLRGAKNAFASGDETPITRATAAAARKRKDGMLLGSLPAFADYDELVACRLSTSPRELYM